MKSLPIALDRLLSNPSYQRIDGKLIKVADDRSRIIIEFKNKKLQTLMGPFADGHLPGLMEKNVIAFVKAGEVTQIFDSKLLPKDQKASSARAGGADGPARRASKPKAEATSTTPVKWKKYAEGRMIGEPVKFISMERGFGLEMEMIEQIIAHLGIVYAPVTRTLPYLEFRKFFHFICDPSFKAFKNGTLPKVAPAPAPVMDDDDNDEEKAGAPAQKIAPPEPPRPVVMRDFRTNIAVTKKTPPKPEEGAE